MNTRRILTTSLSVILVSSLFVGIMLACPRVVNEEIIFTQEFDWQKPTMRTQVDTRTCRLQQSIEINLNAPGRIVDVKLDGYKVIFDKTVHGFEVRFSGDRSSVILTQTGFKPFHTMLRRISLTAAFKGKLNKTATMKSVISVRSGSGKPTRLTAKATAGAKK